MQFQRGQSGNPAGRAKGAPNKFTAAIRTAFERVFDDLQTQVPKRGQKEFNLRAWAKENPSDFYKLMARMVPQEHSGPGGGPIPLGHSGLVHLYLPDNGRLKPEHGERELDRRRLPKRGARERGG